MRLAGALLVLLSHSFPLTGHAADEPLALLLGGATDGGRLAVGMFFVVSGFLVTRSVLAHSPREYLQARLLRLWPALAIVLLVQSLILGPALTMLPLPAYFSAPGTWTAWARGLVFNPQLGLPGVFTTNPYPDAVNGSLWTLRVEAACYVLLLIGRRLDLLRGGRIVAVAMAGFLILAILQGGPSTVPALPRWVWDIRVVAIVQCAVQFAMGALLWVHRDTLPRSLALAIACLLALFLVAHTALATLVFHLVFPYLVICLGLGPAVGEAAMRRLGDISYGTYLYAFPVQQVLISWWVGRVGPWELAAAALFPVLLLALLSRRLVEQPALRLKSRLVRSAPSRIAGAPVLARASRRVG